MRSSPSRSRSERLQVIELIAAAAAVLLALLAVFCAIHAAIAGGSQTPYWWSALFSVVGALALAGGIMLGRAGHESLAAGLLVGIIAARIAVETIVTAPHAFALLWPLYAIPIVIATTLLGARIGVVTAALAPVVFALNYLVLGNSAAAAADFELAVVTNLGLYLLAGAVVTLASARLKTVEREARQVAGSHERTRTELREREEQFQALAESSATGIVIQQDGRLVYGNPHFFEMAQCLSADCFGMSLWDFFEPVGVEELQAQLRRRRTLKGVQPSLLTFKSLKGRTRWCEVAVAEAMFWQKPAIVANILDVTDRVEAQLEVRRERDFSNNIINTAEAIILATDADGRITLFNPAGERITGFSFAEVRTRPYWEMLAPPERREQARAAFDSVRTETSGSVELTWISRGGDEITISWHYVSGRGPDGAFTGLVAVGIDVTQQRLLERQAMVTERLRSLGQISGGVAHDLNNMLAGIIGPVDLLLLTEDDAGKQRTLNSIMAAATRGAETVRRIQSFSKARTDLDMQVFDLRELAEDVIFSLRPRWKDAANRQGITIQVNDHVPAGLMVHASSGEIGNVLMNLIVNACEAMSRDGEINITGEQSGETVTFRVSDTGSGMSPETMASIFQPFFSTKGADNSGLGLAVIHGIILRHGGTITVDSELGVGTTFTVTLPASVATAEPQGTAAAVTPGDRLRILVVDDVPEIADYLAAVATRVGHETAAEYTGEAAWQRLQDEPFDVLITDYGMEGISGAQLAEKAHRLRPGIRVVLVTGWDVSAEEIEGLAGLLKKPCTRAQVEEVLQQLTNPSA